MLCIFYLFTPKKKLNFKRGVFVKVLSRKLYLCMGLPYVGPTLPLLYTTGIKSQVSKKSIK